MSRRPNSTRRLADSGGIPFMGSLHSKSRPSPLLSVGLLAVGALLIVGYMYHGSGSRNGDIAALSRLDDKFSRYKGRLSVKGRQWAGVFCSWAKDLVNIASFVPRDLVGTRDDVVGQR
ncbi:Uncharacterized protein Fot_28721 [Forsythia ovata]|uniref:Uncharacterized protein n=1 Tax=Forsythia ovata TaxID=205694 RepID=A0ABD1TPU0_9LAMI